MEKKFKDKKARQRKKIINREMLRDKTALSNY